MSDAALERLSAAISACRVCRDQPGDGPALPHEPRPVVRLSATARICISGQAPGTRVHASGLPFDDPSGDRLRDWMGIDRATFYDTTRIAIVPMGFCFPGLDRRGADLPPRRECTRLWHDRIFAAMPQLELVLAIGQYAHAYLLKEERGRTLTDTVRGWKKIYYRKHAPRLLPLPHPSWRNTAWMKKNSWFSEEVIPVLRRDVARFIP